MKQTSMKKIMMNGMLCGVLAMGIGTGSAFANESATPAPTAAPAETTTTPLMGAGAVTIQEQKPALPIPAGSLIDLLKTIVQKIEITLTVDDAKRAELLAVITRERIQQSDSLLAQGKTELAAEALQKALADHDLAVQITVVSARKAGGDLSGEDGEQALTKPYRNNIEALTRAMNKVKNPKAKAALAKNIEKSKAKLAKQLEEAAADEDRKEQQPVNNAPAASGELKVTIETEAKEESGSKSDDAKKIRQKLKEERKEAHEQVKEERKAAHEQAKEERKAAHEQAKEERKAAREEANNQKR